MDGKYVIMAFDTKSNSWDYCGQTNNAMIAAERAKSLAIGSIITFVNPGYVSINIKHDTIT